MSGIERKMIAQDMAYYAPIRYSELPRYYRENVEPVRCGDVPGGADGRARLL